MILLRSSWKVVIEIVSEYLLFSASADTICDCIAVKSHVDLWIPSTNCRQRSCDTSRFRSEQKDMRRYGPSINIKQSIASNIESKRRGELGENRLRSTRRRCRERCLSNKRVWCVFFSHKGGWTAGKRKRDSLAFLRRNFLSSSANQFLAISRIGPAFWYNYFVTFFREFPGWTSTLPNQYAVIVSN
jgi:hypothetical protein